MPRKNLVTGTIFLLAIILVGVGILQLTGSPTRGILLANEWVAQGRAFETNQFTAILQGYMASYRLMGAVFLGGGLAGLFYGISRI